MKLYHVTSKAALPRVMKEGLRARRSLWWPGYRVFFWRDLGSARWYSTFTRFAGLAVVLEVSVPDDWAFQVNQAETNKWATRRSIPPSRIRMVR